MPDTALLADEAFLAAFLDCTLPAASFDHCAHLRIAWLMLRRCQLDDAIGRTCRGIARLAAHFGAADKFHHTVTEAFVRLIHARLDRSGTASWAGFLQDNPDFSVDARGLLSRYYSPERLALPDARFRFLDPDRLPLPP